MKVLINTTSLDGKGGVSNHFNGLKGKFENDITFNIIGGRSKKGLFVLGLLFDYFKFLKMLLDLKPDLIHLNPSLNVKAVIRDAIFILLSKIMNKKVIVFFHGWNPNFEAKIDKSSNLFKIIYGQADGFCVLAKGFREKIEAWGISKPVFLETTKIDDVLLEGFNISDKKFSGDVLFLSRLEREKGVYLALDTAKALPNTHFILAGVGSEENEVKKYVNDHSIKNVEFTGFISGNKKIELLKKSSFIFLPSYHEGMPTAVLEGMAFGAIVISRPVGGLVDFFENVTMGYLEESLDYKNFVSSINSFSEEDFYKIRDYNHSYALKHFLASNVAKRLDQTYHTLFKGDK